MTETTYWAGFYDGKINALRRNDDNEHFYPTIFTSKKRALNFFDDVRKVKIVEVKCPKKQ